LPDIKEPAFRFLFQPLHLFAKVQCSLDRTAGFILFEEMLEHIIPVLCSKVYGVQFNAELVAHGLRIGEIRRGGAVFLAIIFLPVLHEQARHLIALLL
jgi:hypothetical protein